jgi:uncharacterized iron-regulated membrane protein
MTHLLTLLHRWLGVVFCLLFTMWFATGIVMHFVPFPALAKAEQFKGLAPFDSSQVAYAPADSIAASKLEHPTRVRLFARTDGPVYVISAKSGMKALHASDLTPANLESEHLALEIASGHAYRRGLAGQPTFVGLAQYDQWTVPNGFDPHRPLYRIAVNDEQGHELYVSSTTGEIVQDTTRLQRRWNYAGSVLHWIYPTALRSNLAAWEKTVWTLSLAALIAALAGAFLGILRIRPNGFRFPSPCRGWHAWHHMLGLLCSTFVLSWMFSGWLSMDNGRLFSSGNVTEAEATAIIGTPAWENLSTRDVGVFQTGAREVEWFAFNNRIFRRERTGLTEQRLSIAGADRNEYESREFLRPDEIDAVTSGVAIGCKSAVVVPATDNYAANSTIPSAPVYRAVCGNSWLHIDGANGAILEKLDGSRRAYRWLYSALHTFDIPALAARPVLRATFIVMLCGCGLMFSFTAVMIAARRVKLRLGVTKENAALRSEG